MSKPFESLRVWHDARRLTARIYSITRGAAFERDFGLRDQIRRASTSVMSNIAEGHERGGPKEYMYFLRIAKGSIGEVRSQLYVAEDVGYVSSDTARELRHHATSIARQIADSIQRAASNSIPVD